MAAPTAAPTAASRAVHRAIRAATLVAAAATSTMALGACDPCTGVANCTGAPRLGVGGQFVSRFDGKPVSGVRVEVVPVDGARFLEGESASGTTDGQGYYQVSGVSDALGLLRADFLVTPPAPHRAYRISGINLRTSVLRGDGNMMGRWVIDPWIYYLAEVKDRSGNPIVGASVRFVRRGGIVTEPAEVQTATDGSGRFTLDMRPEEYGIVVGDLFVQVPGAASAARIAGYGIQTMHEDVAPYVMDVLEVGASIAYRGDVISRGTGERVAGTFTFRRTGGIGIDPSTVVMQSDGSQPYVFAPTPLGEGSVVGDATFLPADGSPATTFAGIVFEAYGAGGPHGFAYRVGEGLRYRGRVLDRATGAPVRGGDVLFRRTGGIALLVDTLLVRTDDQGRFELAPRTAQRGTVSGSLELGAPGGVPLGIVQMATFAADTARALGDFLADVSAPRSSFGQRNP